MIEMELRKKSSPWSVTCLILVVCTFVEAIEDKGNWTNNNI